MPLTCASGKAIFSWSSLSPALERVASYGYSMMGYSPPDPGYHQGEIDIPRVEGKVDYLNCRVFTVLKSPWT